jgi:hypothetical protein
MTPKATGRLRERQEAYPPWLGMDRGSRIAQIVKPELLPEINRRLFAGTLAIGEVGLAEPTASTDPLDDGSFVVEMHSGLMQFIYLVTRTLHSASVEQTAEGIVAPAITREQLVHKVAQIFLDWEAGKFATEPGFQHASFPIDPQRVRIAEKLATNAEIFILAHELGHVIMDGGDHNRYPSPAQWRGAETYPDWLGVRITITAGARLGRRMMYAGMLFAVRVFSFLERLGQKFPGPHPPPGERLGLVKQMARGMFAHDIEFTAVSTVALSYDEQLEGVENVLLGRKRVTEQTVERVRVRLWAILEERLKEGISHEQFIKDMKGSLSVVEHATCKEVADTFREWFADPRAASIPDPMGGHLPLMGAFMRAAIPDLPEPARTVFAAAFP